MGREAKRSAAPTALSFDIFGTGRFRLAPDPAPRWQGRSGSIFLQTPGCGPAAPVSAERSASGSIRDRTHFAGRVFTLTQDLIVPCRHWDRRMLLVPER